MRRCCLICLAAWSVGWPADPVSAFPADGAPAPEAVRNAAFGPADRALIAEAYDLWRTFGDKLWPGWTKVRMPFLYITADYEFALGFPKALRGFEPLGDEHWERKPIQVRRRVLDSHLAASFPVEGMGAVVIGRPEALEKSPAEWVITAAHEMFHVLQQDRGSMPKVAALKIGPADDATWQLNFPFPHQDADVMRLVHLQGYLAFLGARASDPADVRYNAGAALEALAVYRRVLGRLDPSGKFANYSKFQEWTEGVALYTEYRMAEAAAGPGYRPTPAFLRLAGERDYRRLWQETYQSKVFLAKHAGRAARSRTAFYHLGLAKCLLLERLAPDWKERYFAAGVWLDDLLEAAVRKP